MAGFFARFRKRWAANGGVSNPSDAEADTGWAHVANGKPTVERFNAGFQWLDEKDNWLFGQLAGVLARAGMVPAEAGENQLADALRLLASPAVTALGAPGATDWIMPANRSRVLSVVTGGGGASTPSDANVKSGAGGGGGGTSFGLFGLAGGTRVSVTVGRGGEPNGYTPGSGGTSSFGAFNSATGGRGAGVLSNAVSGGAPGVGAGGFLNLSGSFGGDGHNTLVLPTGYGGASFWGGSPRAGVPNTPGGPGAAGLAPGAGAAAPYNASPPAPGGPGAHGLVLLVPLA